MTIESRSHMHLKKGELNSELYVISSTGERVYIAGFNQLEVVLQGDREPYAIVDISVNMNESKRFDLCKQR